MAFADIAVVEVDRANVDSPSLDTEVRVSFVLSDTPPAEWKSYFEAQAPSGANAKIVGNIARYNCPSHEAAIRKYGPCWNAVADLVADANRHYLEIVLRQRQELGRQAEWEHRKEQPPAEFEIEFDRYMTRDDTRKP
jgi:hypothetical protein